MIVLLCVVGVIAYVIHFASVVGIGTPTFIGSVYINDYSFAGLTREEGFAKSVEIENEWLNEEHVLSYLDQSWTFTRAMVNADIDFEAQMESAWNLGHVGNLFQRKRMIETIAAKPIYLTADITYDDAALQAFIDSIAAAIDVAPVNAVVVPDVDKPLVVSESSTGLAVNKEQLKEQLITLIETGDSDTTIPVETQFPAVQSDDVSFQLIASFSTDVSFRSSASRSNVRLALNAFNGLMVSPGETISFNEIVGERTEERGYKSATEFAGDTTTTGIGGGICQASTTLYNAVIMADMDVIERWNHTMTVSYVDPSVDAAVFGMVKDLRFENNTAHPIYIYTSVTSEEATVSIYGNRPEYRYVLESVMIEENLPSTRKTTIEDTEGKHVYYTDDQPLLYSEGKPGCISEGWVVAYDWETGAEVDRVKVSKDYYKPGASVYWVGVHTRAEVGLITDY